MKIIKFQTYKLFCHSQTKKKKDSGRVYNYNALTTVVNCNFGTRPTWYLMPAYTISTFMLNVSLRCLQMKNHNNNK